MTRPAYHVDVATAAIPTAIAQPPSGIQTAGFPAHSKFASAWANWLFNFLGGWTRELDQSCLRAADLLSPDTPQLLQGSGSGFSLPTGSGLANLDPNGGGAYVLSGRRVDLSAAALTEKYPTGFTLPSNSTVYAHAREETASGGSATGELIITTNASEVSYQTIWTGTTNGVNLTAQTHLASDDVQWIEPVEMLTRITIDDPVDEVALSVTGAGTAVPVVLVTTVGNATAVQAAIGNSDGYGFVASTGSANGTGFASSMIGSDSAASGFYASADATTAGVPMRVDNDGINAGILSTATGGGPAGQFDSTGAALSALAVTGGVNQAVNAVGAGSGVGVRAFSGSTAGANAITALPLNATGFGVSAQTGAGATSAARAIKASADGAGSAIEAVATGGYPLILQGDSTSPTYGELHFNGQNADPTDIFDGTVMWHTGQRQLKVSDASDMTYRGVWTSIGGRAHEYDLSASATTAGGAVWVEAASTSLTGSGAPKVAGRSLLLKFSCECRSTTGGAANTLNVQFTKNGAAIVASRRSGTGAGIGAGFLMADTGTAWQRSVHYTYAVSSTVGDATYTVEIQTATANNIQVRDALLEVVGLF